MKSIIIILLLGISLSYSPDAAVNYAKNYCYKYNPDYNNYKYEGGDDANFVSQCMFSAGQSFDRCLGKDNKGMIKGVFDLELCLKSKGWRSSSSRPTNFKPGYPVFVVKPPMTYAFLVTGISANYIYGCSHNPDVCDEKINANYIDYYFL